MNSYGLNPEISTLSFLGDQENRISFPNDHYNDEFIGNSNNVSVQIHPSSEEYQILPYNSSNNLPFDPTEVPEIPDTCFNYINELLRDQYFSSDDQFDNPNSTLEDYMATQMSCNNFLDSGLHFGENFSSRFSADINQCPPPEICQSTNYCLDDYINLYSSTNQFQYAPNIMNCSFVDNDNFRSSLVANLPSCHLDNVNFGFMGSNNLDNFYSETANLQVGDNNVGGFSGNSRRRRSDEDEDEEDEDNGERRNKHSAPSNEVIEQIEEYGDVILCPEGRSKPGALCNNSNRTQDSSDSSSTKGSKKRGNNSKGEFVDLRGLLTRCAQCIAQVDLNSAYDMLNQIRVHSSACGDFLQRVAHYLADGLEARLEGKGWELTRSHEEVSAAEVLKANRIYVASVPFQIMSYYTMNKTIAGLVEEAPSIHIIDFGIDYGLQWPCIIQNLSRRPNGPPRIRITGVDYPQRGFRPSERVEETGGCLAKYCQKYNVAFEYSCIAKKWEDVEVEELKIDRNEPLVVNCLYRAHLLMDESVVEENSPRDAFLKLVRKIKPDMFMHAVVNNTSNVPFFLNRFKEAMFHYSALFDIFECMMRREDKERMLLESKIYGAQALNVIACEGVERVERPESYKQWQVRTQRAGFKQVALDRELVRRARAMVRRSFRQEFSYDEDGYWVVQGWKGRILYAISCWKPS